MKNEQKHGQRPHGVALDNRRGGVLIFSVVMLAVASLAVGSILTATVRYHRLCQNSFQRNRASFLAEAGLSAAIVKLNVSGDASISYAASRDYFSTSNNFDAADWGFLTHITVQNGKDVLLATGRYEGHTVDISAEVSLGAGSRSIHALYAHALFAGNSDGDTNYTLRVGGTGSGADFVNGDTYSGGNVELSGDSLLRLPEAFLVDSAGDGICDPDVDTWQSSYAPQTFTSPLDQSAFDTYVAAQAPNMGSVYSNGKYDEGEAFVDTIGNGIYDVGEPFTDTNGNGVRDSGDEFIDRNGNGVYDAGVDTVVDNGNGQYDPGEEWTEDTVHRNPKGKVKRVNGVYDPAGGFYNRKGRWVTKSWTADWPAEAFEDVGDGKYSPSEPYVDQNGIYDPGEQYLDDRNGIYDYGTQASGNITGMPSPGPGQSSATGSDAAIAPPDLSLMHYDLDRNSQEPASALARWGNDVAVTADDYSGNGHVLNTTTSPEHIFVRNVPQSSPGGGNNEYRRTYGGVEVRSRGYDKVYDDNGDAIDDYFLEDPTDPTYNTISGESAAIAQNDGNRTHRMLINVLPEDNVKLYYVDGNVYLHATPTWALGFREPGTRITIVASGNITISDEFYYNAAYDPSLQYSDVDSSVVNDPQDALCLIALKRPNCSDSGNVYIGDPAMGTGGSIHAMLYAENDFVDNNINSADQQFISVFGNMSAGNQIRLNRDVGGGHYRTRLDVTLDQRIRDGSIIVPGLPHPVGGERSIQIDTAWHIRTGTWSSWSKME